MVVERDAGSPDGFGVPTIAELLTAYRDRTGASYEEMARKVGDDINRSTMHKLATKPPAQFPKLPRTVQRLADLLEVPPTTIVLAFAAGLSRLSQLLPPGTDWALTDRDHDAVISMVRSLIEARQDLREASRETVPLTPGLFFTPREDDEAPPITGPEPATVHEYGLAARRGTSEGRRLRQQQDDDAGA
jgi:hypothetical protein